MLDDETKAHVANALEQYCDERVPIHVRDKVVLQFRFRGNAVVLFERRPGFRNPEQWSTHNVARFRLDASTQTWLLDCRDRNGRWHFYEPAPPSSDICELLRVVSDDPTGIFWG